MKINQINSKTFKIENFGCQMNVADASEIENSLLKEGYSHQKSALADIIIINSCAVRGSAEERVYGRLRHYAQLKLKSPFTLVLMGCVAQKDKQNVFNHVPGVDLVIGTYQKNDFPLILNQYLQNQVPQSFSSMDQYQFQQVSPSSKYPFKADLTIIHGCNNYCTYCIVPFTRGQEISRPASEIIKNVYQLVDQGVTEILLLGQNVNSYGHDLLEGSFAQLLYQLTKIQGLRRIRFLTSHPKDFSDELINVISESKKICKYIHLPLQAGSNQVLEKMGREYTYEHYLSIIEKLRAKISHLVLSTDILVGFPYEKDNDFQKTLDALIEIRFDEAYMFKYNTRTGTTAANYPDLVPENEKKYRLQQIIDTQHQIAKEINLSQLGHVEEILLESISKNNPNELIGKTDGNKPVVVQADFSQISQYTQVILKSLKGNTFQGEILAN